MDPPRWVHHAICKAAVHPEVAIADHQVLHAVATVEAVQEEVAIAVAVLVEDDNTS